MRQVGLTLFAVAVVGTAQAQQLGGRNVAEDASLRHFNPPAKAAAGGAKLAWNAGHLVLFRGTVTGVQESAPMADGKSWTSLLVKLANGGTALVELGPKDYVDAQSMRLRLKAPVWVAGSKAYTDNGDSVILAQRLSFDESRHAFRRNDGKPFWEK